MLILYEPDITRIRGEHLEILSTLRALEEELEAPAPTERLAGVRAALKQMVYRHLREEDWLIFPWLLTHHRDELADAARVIIAEHGDFQGAVDDHIRRWPAVCVAADWHGYRTAARRMAHLLRQRIAAEERQLYAALRYGHSQAA